MAKAAKLDVKHVLPGHGRPGGIEIVKGEGEFMRQLRSAVEKEIKQGKTLSSWLYEKRITREHNDRAARLGEELGWSVVGGPGSRCI